MAPPSTEPTRSGSVNGLDETGARKRRKIEKAESQNDPATQDTVDGTSRERRRIAKKARRAASTAEKVSYEVAHKEGPRLVPSPLSSCTMLTYVQAEYQNLALRRLLPRMRGG